MINEKALQVLVKSRGWQEAVKIFEEEVIKSLLPESFKTDGKSPEVIAVECMAREKSSKMVRDVVDKINKIGNKQELTKESWE